MKKQLLFGEEARKKMISGVEKVAEAVKTTLGPKGRLVMMDKKYGPPLITKDGVTVAKEIELEDPYENMGAQLLKEVASSANNISGDGSTTATVLAYSMVKEGMKAYSSGVAPIELKKGMERALKDSLEEIEKMSKPVGKDDIVNVAAISANNDFEIGKTLLNVFSKVGADGVVTVEESKTTETTTKFVEGMQFDNGYLSPHFLTDRERSEVYFENPYILLYNKSISNMMTILPILEKVAAENVPLLILAENVEGEALTTLTINNLRGVLKVAAVKAPGFGEAKRENLEDIAALTGGKLISEEMGDRLEEVELKDLGRAKSIRVTKDTTTIVGDENTSEAVSKRVEHIKGLIKAEENKSAKELLEKRLAKLTGGVAVIKVGASTEIEMKEKKDRVDDTLSATRAALKYGVVPGGGLALLTVSKNLSSKEIEFSSKSEETGYNIVKRALEEPIRQIAQNAGVDGSVVVNECLKKNNYGFNANTCEYGNLISMGIIDPAKVSEVALEKAVSIVSLLLTTECIITDVDDKEK